MREKTGRKVNFNLEHERPSLCVELGPGHAVIPVVGCVL